MTWTWNDVTAGQIRSIAVKLGQPMPDVGPEVTVGRAMTHGIKLQWEFDPITSSLTVEAFNETFFIKYKDVYEKISKLLGDS